MYDPNIEKLANEKHQATTSGCERKYLYSTAKRSTHSLADVIFLILGNMLIELGTNIVSTITRRMFCED